MNTLERVKSELAQIVLKNDLQDNWDNLINYFHNSPNFCLIGQKDGLSGNGYFDSEEDDSNKYRKYKAVSGDLIIKVTVYDFRKILVDVNKGSEFNGYSLELNEQCEGSIPEYRIV